MAKPERKLFSEWVVELKAHKEKHEEFPPVIKISCLVTFLIVANI